MKKVKILFTDIHQPAYQDKNPFREGFEWGKKVILDLCVEVDLDEVFNNYIDKPELRVRNGRVIKFGEYVIEFMLNEQKKKKDLLQDRENVSRSLENE
jgi:hypothetical protein